VKRRLILLSLLVLAASTVFGQKIAKPTLTPKEETPAQREMIEDAIKKHDLKQYDEAINRYQQVLDVNPDSTLAMYELCMSLYSKGEKEKALETSLRGSKYVSAQLPLFYMTIANVIDDLGKPDEAVRIYRDAVSILRSDKGLAIHLSTVLYNLGVTYVKQKKYPEARETLKKAVEHNFAYSSPHYALALVYNGTKYKVPAFMAAARLLTLEMNTARTGPSATIVREALAPAKKDEQTGSINILLGMNAPKDEGDFTIYDLILGTLTTVKTDKEANKSEEEIFADSFDSTIAMLGEDKKLRNTFVGKNYIPFLMALKAQGHSKTLAYFVLHKGGNQIALKWLTVNSEKLKSLSEWAKVYTPAAK
jgi:tetratricopeptide (TPR) repeat protein